MSRQRWGVLVLVLAALVLSVLYGLRDTTEPSTATEDLKPLQSAAALDPCPPGLGPGFPDLTLPCLGGGASVRLQSAGPGLPMIVNLYGSWCAPCREEMPLLRQFYDKTKGRVAVVGIDTTESSPALGLRFAKDIGQRWSAIYDDDRSVGAHFGPGVPKTILVTAQGKVAYVVPGQLKSLEQLESLVQQHLGVTV